MYEQTHLEKGGICADIPFNGDGSAPPAICSGDFRTVCIDNIGSQVTLAGDVFPYSGHMIEAWNTEADGSGTSYKTGDAVTLTEDLTLYAQWFDMKGIVYVGSQTNIDQNLPMYSSYSYGYTEQIYTADEIGAYSAITSLSFNVTDLPSDQAAWKGSLYLLDTEKENFADGYDTVSLDGIDLVFSGEIPFTSTGWQTLVFDRPFIYNPDSNLLVAFVNNTGKWEGGMKYAVYKGQANCSAYVYSDGKEMKPDLSSWASRKSIKN